MLHRALILGSLVLASCVSLPERADTDEAPLTSHSNIAPIANFGANPGALKMYEYVPAGLQPNAPIVVVMHGCVQSATDAATIGFTELADEYKFLVVFPEQQTVNNQLRCFNWAGEYGDTANLTRGKGENESIKEMVDKSIATHKSDPKRVFAVGFSGGGATAALLAAIWPDVFNAAATFAGIPYDCTTQFAEVSTCLKPGMDKTAQDWGDRVRAAMHGYNGPWPRMSIWQGSADTVVAPMNRTQLIRQWTNVEGLSQTPSATDTVDGASHSVFNDANGKTLIETYEVRGMDHGVPVQPSTHCGATAQYAIDKGICAARHVATFFGIAGASN